MNGPGRGGFLAEEWLVGVEEPSVRTGPAGSDWESVARGLVQVQLFRHFPQDGPAQIRDMLVLAMQSTHATAPASVAAAAHER